MNVIIGRGDLSRLATPAGCSGDAPHYDQR